MKRTLCMLTLGAALSLGHASQAPNGASAPAAAQTPAQTGSPTASAANNLPSPGDSANPDATPAPAADFDLQLQIQSQIRDALGKDPSLINQTVKVTASLEAIELSGSLTSGKERQTAGRIAQSYARGKKVLNHIVVTGRGSAPAAPNAPEKPNPTPPANLSGSVPNPAPSRNHPL